MEIFPVLVKVHFKDFLCKSVFWIMYLYKDRAEKRRGPSKTPKDDKYMFQLYKDRRIPKKVGVEQKV